jgi:uncharacterized protein YvpB
MKIPSTDEREKAPDKRRGARLGLFLGTLLLLTLFTGSLETAEAAGVPASYRISGVPVYIQSRNLSCEYAAAKMVTAYWGRIVTESQFIRNIPVRNNPHFGFRGNINGWGGGTRDYGIYSEPIANYLDTLGFYTNAFYGNVAMLKAEIARGRPVIVWVTYGLQYSRPIRTVQDGAPVKLIPGEHTVVVTGYDQTGVYVNGPAEGVRTKFSWVSFQRSWSYFDNMALSIWR